MRGSIVLVGSLLLAACARGTCCPRVPAGVAPSPSLVGVAPAAPLGSAARAPAIPSPSVARSATPAPASGSTEAAVADFRARLEAAAKTENRTEDIAALVRAHPSEAAKLDLETWAGVAPGALLVYDLRPFLDRSSDAAVTMMPFGSGAPSGAGDGGSVVRVAMALLPSAFGTTRPAFVLREDGFVLVADESHHAAVAAALDRVAVVGGGHVRVRCVAVDDPERVASELGIVPPAPNPDPAAPLTAMGKVVSPLETVTDEQWTLVAAHRVDALMSVDAVAGSLRGSKRTTTMSYLQDFDVKEGGACFADPIIGSLEAGFAVNAYVAPVATPKEVDLRFEWTRVVAPMPTFKTTLACAHVAPGGVAPSLVIDLPELRAVNGDVLLPARVGAGAFVRIGAIMGVLARVESVTAGSEPKPAWRRVHPSPLAAVLGLPGVPAQHFLDMHVRAWRVGATEPTELTAPKMLSLEAQRSTVSILEQMSYIADFDVEVSQGSYIADVIVGTLETGLTIGARVLSQPDGTVAIDGTLAVADVLRPFRRTTISLGVGTPVTIDLPTTRQATESFRVIAKEGEPSALSMSVPTEGGPTRIEVTIVWRRHLEGVSPGPK